MLQTAQFFENLDCFYLVLDHSFTITSCNKFTNATLTESTNSVVGKKLLSYFHIDDHVNASNILTDATDGESPEYVHRFKMHSGRYLWCKWQLVVDANTGDIHFLGRDISEQKRIKSAFESIESVTNTGYWEIDLDTQQLFWSDNVHRVHETDPETYTPKLEDGLSFYHPDSLPILMESLQALEETGQSYNRELKFISSKGKDLIVHVTGHSESKHGRVIRSFGTFRDLTKQKEDDIVRQNIEQRIVLALKGAQIGVWEYDILEDTLSWDDRLFEIYGRSKQSFSGTLADWLAALHPDDLEKAQISFGNAVEEHTQFDHKFRVVTESGDIKHVHGLASFIYDENNNAVKATGVNMDLSESEKNKSELLAATQQAQESARAATEFAKQAKAADKQKTVFLANMSHELRTPISGIMGLVELLFHQTELAKDDKSLERSYLELIKKSSDHLLSVISDILDFSKIEAGMIEIVEEEFDFHDMLEHLVTDFKNRASEKGIHFDYSSNGFTKQRLVGDSHRLKQVLYNVLGNAIKFTDSGKISVETSLEKTAQNKANVKLIVSDTGIGISDDKLDSLFMPFEQLDASPARKSQGAGLGLSITKELIGLMQGSISVSSKEGVGTEFVIELPVKLSKPASPIAAEADYSEEQHKPEQVLNNLVALVAEDHDINQVIVASLLQQLGIKCVIAENGQEALDCLENTDAERFSFILMDCQMPILDGFDATGLIRQDEKYKHVRDIPIIALTANALVGDKEKCLDAGMDDYMAKPITLETLQTTLLRSLVK